MNVTSQQLIDEFKAKYETQSGKVFVVHTSNELLDALRSVFREKQAKRIALAELPEPLIDALRGMADEMNIEALSQPYDRGALPGAIDDADVGVSSVSFAIAETGTVVEFAVNDDLRLVSSLPDTHVAIVQSQDIVPMLDDAAGLMRSFFDAHGDAACVSFISGPSRTGDIEMKLTLGVHGPKESYVIVVDERINDGAENEEVANV